MSAAMILMLVALAGICALGAPIGPAMIGTGFLYLLFLGKDIGLAGEMILNGLFNSFVLLAVPLFIFAANIMNAGKITDRLLDFSLAMVGRFRGGLGHVNILCNVIMSGMSGSAVADASGMGIVLVDMMRRENRFPPAYAAAVTGAAATIGPIIPPSIPMVLYAMVSDQSVGALFLGGVGPGLLMALALMIMVAISSHRRGFPKEPPIPWSRYPGIFWRAIPPLLMPGILLGGIYGGAFTPTEAAAAAGFYALILSMLVYRTVGIKALLEAVEASLRTSAVVALIIAGAFIMNYVVATERIPDNMALWLKGLNMAPLAFMFIVNIVFLLLGCLLDATTMMLVLVPIIVPTLKALGIDLVYFGVVIVVNMMIGLITPPYGVLLFVINSLTGIPMGAIIREMWAFTAVLIISLIIMVVVPDVVLWLPRATGYVH